MNKLFLRLTYVLMVLAMGMTTVSCGGDDASNEGNNPPTESNDYDLLILGTWTITQDDPTWKCIVTFKSNGTFESKEYYDIEGNHTFTEYEGTYTGTYRISGNQITIKSVESVVDFYGTINSLTSSDGIFTDKEGYSLYLSKSSDNNNGGQVDNYQYDIVGNYSATYYWKYSGLTSTCTINVYKNGTFAWVTDDSKGNGTWNYLGSKKWNLTGFNDSLWGGDYTMVGHDLICTTVFNDGSSRTVEFDRQ